LVLLTQRPGMPWKKFPRSRKQRGKLTWVAPDSTPNVTSPELKFTLLCSRNFIKKLMKQEGKKFSKIEAKLLKGKNASFEMKTKVSAKFDSKQESFTCKNVVGILEGSDPKLKEEFIVVSAHLDHLGIRRPIDGDAIYNGTMDNASGSVGVLALAKAFSQLPVAPKRSFIFLWVTGEEMGLLGSDYFAHYPSINKNRIVANLNMDIMGGLYVTNDIVAQGYEHSNLAGSADFIRDYFDIHLSPDPTPDRVRFIRSDQFSFVKQGVPAIRLVAGFKAATDTVNAEKRFFGWRKKHYHKPSDDMAQLLEAGSFELETKINFAAAYFIANRIEKIEWNPKSSLYKKYGVH